MLSGWCRQIPAVTAMSTQPHPTQRQDDSYIIQQSKNVTILPVLHSGEVRIRDVNNTEAVNLEHAAMPNIIYT